MDGISALESGTLPPTASQPVEVVLPGAVGARWASDERLRPGGGLGPRATALVPVVEAWARQAGLPVVVEPRLLAKSLRRIGLTFRDRKELLLHPADASRLWAAVRAAWAPAMPPGDPRGRPKARKQRRPRKLLPPPTMPLFHEAVRRQGRQCTPLVDSVGRVWPRAAVAVLALGGDKKAIDNARRELGKLYKRVGQGGEGLYRALKEQASWRGVFWRHLQPWELRHIPPGTKAGDRVLALGWYLGGCPNCQPCSSAETNGTVSESSLGGAGPG